MKKISFHSSFFLHLVSSFIHHISAPLSLIYTQEFPFSGSQATSYEALTSPQARKGSSYLQLAGNIITADNTAVVCLRIANLCPRHSFPTFCISILGECSFGSPSAAVWWVFSPRMPWKTSVYCSACVAPPAAINAKWVPRCTRARAGGSIPAGGAHAQHVNSSNSRGGHIISYLVFNGIKNQFSLDFANCNVMSISFALLMEIQ